MLFQVRNSCILLLTAGIIFLCLYFSSSLFIVYAALVLLALNLADIFVRFLWDLLPSQTLHDITEKAVFITGCDTGFGNKLARQLDAKGLTVFAGCLFAEGPGASNLRKECSKKLHVVQIDVIKDDQVNAALKYVKSILNDKPLHALVNNAGVFTVSECELMEISELRRVLEVNTIGVARVTQAFLPLLRKSKGRIVFTVSIAGFKHIQYLGAYAMSKHAVLAYANTIRRELIRFSVSVHTIEPSVYNTEMKNRAQILSIFDNGFDQAPEETRQDYGGEDYKILSENLYNILDYAQSNRIEEVTNCMMDAITAKYPKMQYHPGFVAKLSFWLKINKSQELGDIFAHLVLKFLVYISSKSTASGKKAE